MTTVIRVKKGLLKRKNLNIFSKHIQGNYQKLYKNRLTVIGYQKANGFIVCVG